MKEKGVKNDISLDKGFLRIKKLERKLAAYLHAVNCFENHTDQCGWFYEDSWDNHWTASNCVTHKYYLKMALNILIKLSTSDKLYLRICLNKAYETKIIYLKNMQSIEKIIQSIE